MREFWGIWLAPAAPLGFLIFLFVGYRLVPESTPFIWPHFAKEMLICFGLAVFLMLPIAVFLTIRAIKKVERAKVITGAYQKFARAEQEKEVLTKIAQMKGNENA